MNVEGTTILTFTGRYVDPLDLRVADIDIFDIAHALSNQCRYSGHVSTFYSVAEHSVRCARTALAHGEPIEIVRWALLHDATEAYLVDLPRPLKHHSAFGEPYRLIESDALLVIAAAFGLSPVEPAAVKGYDLTLLATERRDLLPDVPGVWPVLNGIEPLEERITPWPAANAERAFLRFFELLNAADEISGELAA